LCGGYVSRFVCDLVYKNGQIYLNAIREIISLIFQLMHTLYTLQKAPTFTLKTLKNFPLHVSVAFLRPSSGGPWTVLCEVTKLRSVDISLLWKCAICAQTAQFYNKCTSTDLNFVT
jgi:hypothetical protein